MKPSMLTAMVFAVVAASGAAFGYASCPTVVTWADNFDSQPLGIPPGNMNGWTGGGPDNWLTVSDGGNTVVSDGSSPGNYWSYAWTNQIIGGQLSLGLEPYEEQIFHFKARQVFAGNSGSRQWQVIFHFVDTYGIPIGGWRVTGAGTQAYVYDSAYVTKYAGAQVPWPDQEYHDFDLHWFKSTGVMQWYFDGVLRESWTYAERAGTDAAVIQWDNKSAYNDVVYYDDVQAGTVPEPSSLMAFGAFGLGLVGMVRRRKA